MLRLFLKRQTQKLTALISTRVLSINHNAVIKDLTGRAELTGSYLLMIVCSCLVGLLGLLTNSVAVVIGAMLISPLMGPIFTAAMAFSLGDLRLARKAFKSIAISILLTVLVATLFTLGSPLKAPTQEILSRTRPNIYDLLIATIAGTAGAYALCTRSNYLFVTTGVAVATAVIPPLSVVGYGIGTGQFTIAMGGFLLFFTNLVAIVISSDLVFHVFRFRTSMVEEARYPPRKRAQILGTVLVLLSVPLIHTLVIDIKTAKFKNRIERVMKRHLDRKDHSRMIDYSFHPEQNGLTVSASVNTVKYFDPAAEKEIGNELEKALGGPVRLDLEQVIVKSGHVELEIQSIISPPVAPSPRPPRTLATLQQEAVLRLKEGCDEVRPYFKPYPITQANIRFSAQTESVTVAITIARDQPFSEDERRWLQVALEKKIGGSVALELETIPFLPALNLGTDGELDAASRKALLALQPLVGAMPPPRFVMTAPQTKRGLASHKTHALKKIEAYLVKDLGLPQVHISWGPDRGLDYRVRVEPK